MQKVLVLGKIKAPNKKIWKIQKKVSNKSCRLERMQTKLIFHHRLYRLYKKIIQFYLKSGNDL